MNVFKYLSRYPFWVNLLVALVFLFLLGYLFLLSLGWFTNHGDYLKVPPVTGKNVDEAVKLLEDQGFEVVIQDSVYYDTIPKYTVIKQLPNPDATVKRNRTVFLTINRAVPPPVDMPKLEGLTLRFAINLLERNHLHLGDTTSQPDFAKGTVMQQLYHNARIAAGTKVPWGAHIDLVISAGVPNEQMLVPDVLGLAYSEAKALLDGKGIVANVVDSTSVSANENAYVLRQSPEVRDEYGNPLYIKPGQIMDLWLTPTPVDADSIRHKKIIQAHEQQ